MRDAWTDDLNGKVDQGFRRADADIRSLRIEAKAEFNSLRSEMDQRFDRMNERFDGLQRTIIVVNGGVMAALLGVIATQL